MRRNSGRFVAVAGCALSVALHALSASADPGAPPPVAGALRFRGNERSTPGFLRRTADLAPGQTLSPEDAAEARRLLMNTRLFESASVRALDEKGPDGRSPVEIAVKERRSLGIYPDFYQNGDRTTFGLGVEETHLGGEGRRLGGRAWGGSDGEGAETWYGDPWLLGENLTLDVGLGAGRWFDRYYDVNGDLFAENRIDYVVGGFSLGTRLTHRLRVWTGLTVRDDDMTPLAGSVVTETGRFNFLRAGAMYDDTAYEVTHIEGWRAWTEVDQGTTALAGDFRFRKAGAGGAWYHRPWSDHLVIVDGWAWYGSDLPFRELFSLGGQGSLRGYQVGEFRGSRVVRGSAEYQVPFWHPELMGVHADVSAAVFYDQGWAWSAGFHPQWSDSAAGAGAGLRIVSPELASAGCRLDFGYGFETGNVLAYFSFGASF